ncbi:hypothetical protein LXL04_039283 [Taraxacum kok-saghyz]
MNTNEASTSGGGKFHTVQPLRDLKSNWEVDLANDLQEYLLKICSGEITGGEDDTALLLQGSIQVYSRKVEYLYSLVVHALEFISQQSQQHDKPDNTPDAEEENDRSKDNNTPLNSHVKPPGNLVVLEGDCLDTSGDNGELESYLIICFECVICWYSSSSSVFLYSLSFDTACWHSIICYTIYAHMHTGTAHFADHDPIGESAGPMRRLYSRGFIGSPRELVTTAVSRGHRTTPVGIGPDVTGPYGVSGCAPLIREFISYSGDERSDIRALRGSGELCDRGVTLWCDVRECYIFIEQRWRLMVVILLAADQYYHMFAYNWSVLMSLLWTTIKIVRDYLEDIYRDRDTQETIDQIISEKMQPFLKATNDLYKDFILLDGCDAITVDEFLSGNDEINKNKNNSRGSSIGSKSRKTFMSPSRRSGGLFMSPNKRSAGKGVDPGQSQNPCDGKNDHHMDDHDFNMDDGFSQPEAFDDDDDEDPWKPLNPREKGNLKVFFELPHDRGGEYSSVTLTNLARLLPMRQPRVIAWQTSVATGSCSPQDLNSCLRKKMEARALTS